MLAAIDRCLSYREYLADADLKIADPRRRRRARRHSRIRFRTRPGQTPSRTQRTASPAGSRPPTSEQQERGHDLDAAHDGGMA
jgi:hypothetical protein